MSDNYKERFSRNIGIMSEAELDLIRSKKIAVGGLGLGGSIFINLVRMGFEKFHISDPDRYERPNINRQRMAKENTTDCRKDECLLTEAKSINPDIEVTMFREGVNAENVDLFTRDVDFVVDAIDIFALAEKLVLHEVCMQKKIPVITCAAVGYGAAVIAFNETTPSYAEVSGIRVENSYEVNIERFANFTAPEIPGYMLTQVKAALSGSSHIPFVVPGVEICAGLIVCEIAKHLLDFGERVVAPNGIYFDPVKLSLEIFDCNYTKRELLK